MSYLDSFKKKLICALACSLVASSSKAGVNALVKETPDTPDRPDYGVVDFTPEFPKRQSVGNKNIFSPRKFSKTPMISRSSDDNFVLDNSFKNTYNSFSSRAFTVIYENITAVSSSYDINTLNAKVYFGDSSESLNYIIFVRNTDNGAVILGGCFPLTSSFDYFESYYHSLYNMLGGSDVLSEDEFVSRLTDPNLSAGYLGNMFDRNIPCRLEIPSDSYATLEIGNGCLGFISSIDTITVGNNVLCTDYAKMSNIGDTVVFRGDSSASMRSSVLDSGIWSWDNGSSIEKGKGAKPVEKKSITSYPEVKDSYQAAKINDYYNRWLFPIPEEEPILVYEPINDGIERRSVTVASSPDSPDKTGENIEEKDSKYDVDSDENTDSSDKTSENTEEKDSKYDVDDDGTIDSLDALYVLRDSVGVAKIPESRRSIADADKDGEITSADALKILRYSVGLDDD